MAKSPPPVPRLPWGRKPSKPGIGLSQILRDLPSEDETPTPLLPPPMPTAAITGKATQGLTDCPLCSGSTFSEIRRIDVPPGTPQNNREFGRYKVRKCTACGGSGHCTADEAVAIRLVMASAKDPETNL